MKTALHEPSAASPNHHPGLADVGLDTIHGMLEVGRQVYGTTVVSHGGDGFTSVVVIQTIGRRYRVTIEPDPDEDDRPAVLARPMTTLIGVPVHPEW